jgi:hypothetical protein
MSALTPAEPLSSRDSATRVTPSRLAASVTLISASHSRRTSWIVHFGHKDAKKRNVTEI